MYELHARGTARAADLAAALALPANQVSFHLRQLARYDLIQDAPHNAATKRDRFWTLTDAGRAHWSPADAQFQPGGLDAARYWRQHTTARVHDEVDRFYAAAAAQIEHGVENPNVRASNDVPMLLTRTEAEQFSDELYELLTRWAEHGRKRSQIGDTADRQSYLILTFLQPQEPTIHQ
jgi:predicted ArsR family transcriptional regulator